MTVDSVILVPTKNRLNWCQAKLRYYSRQKRMPSIIFLDASEKNNESNLLINSKKRIYPSVFYLHLPGKSIHFSIEEGLKYAKNKWKYYAICGDDDFYTVNFLSRATELLNSDPSVVAVLGKSVISRMRIKNDKIQILTCANYWNPYSIMCPDQIDRFTKITTNYLNLEFALKRVDMGLLIAEAVNKFTGELSFQESRFAEYCSSTAIPILGKIIDLKILMMIRGDHPNRPNSKKQINEGGEYDLNSTKGLNNYLNFVLNFSNIINAPENFRSKVPIIIRLKEDLKKESDKQNRVTNLNRFERRLFSYFLKFYYFSQIKKIT